MVFIDDKQSLKSAKHDFETAYIRQVIEANGFRLRKAAEALDIHCSALMNKIKTKGITINKPMEVSDDLPNGCWRSLLGMLAYLVVFVS